MDVYGAIPTLIPENKWSHCPENFSTAHCLLSSRSIVTSVMMCIYYHMQNVLSNIRLFVQACEIYLRINAKSNKKAIPPKNKIKFNLMENVSADLRYIPYRFDNLKYLWVVTCALGHFSVAIPMKKRDTEFIGESSYIE